MKKVKGQLRSWSFLSNRIYQYFKVVSNSLFSKVLLGLLPFFSHAQPIANYVTNGGFEEHFTCTNTIISIAKGWRTIDSSLQNVLYYHPCTPPSPVPWDGVSYQYPRNGNGFGGTTFLCQPPQCNPNVNREYFRNRLKGALENGKTYCVRMFANIRDNSTYGIDAIGAFFSDNSIDTITKCSIPLTYINPQVQNPSGNILTDTMNWTLITGTFIATGSEKHLIVGNFKSDAATNKTLINPTYLPTIGCDVYLDDVSCIDVDLPAYAGPDIWFIPGNNYYIGRPQDVGIDEACMWFKLPNTTTAIDTAAGIWVTPTATSTYVVRQEICGNVKWDTVVLHLSAVGIAEIERLNDKFIISPNPANDVLIVSFDLDGLEKKFRRVEILNSIGQLVKEVELNYSDKKALVDIREIPPGAYFLNVKNEQCGFHKRFIIAR